MTGVGTWKKAFDIGALSPPGAAGPLMLAAGLAVRNGGRDRTRIGGVFSRLRIEREAILSVLVLHQALRQGEATAALARRIAAELRRLDLRPRGAPGGPA